MKSAGSGGSGKSLWAQKGFSFGENWDQFVREHFSEERLADAKQHLLAFLQLPDLAGRTFLDVGCGSGLHSAAAFLAGAEWIVSFDVDPASVRATNRVREALGSPAKWQVLHGSVLDRAFLDTLEPADIVYSWGVLHHTGRMWEAIENVGRLMGPEAKLYIALYVTTSLSGYWLGVKQRYNKSTELGKRIIELQHIVRHAVVPNLVRLKNPLAATERTRGMSFMTDVRDWLGGLPFEDASLDEVLRFCRGRMGLQMTNINANACFAEYLFEAIKK